MFVPLYFIHVFEGEQKQLGRKMNCNFKLVGVNKRKSYFYS
jgi:hypothetical protein